MRTRAFFSLLLDFLFPPRASEKRVREMVSTDVSQHLLPTFFETDAKEQITFLLPYHEKIVRDCILETKYHGNKKATLILSAILNDFLVEYIEEESALKTQQFVLVSIPLSHRRKRARGYNQSEEIARAALRAAPSLELRPELLTRTRDTAPQTNLTGSERRKNMRDAFLAQNINPAYTYIVVDDVITTGTTLLAGMNALKKAGAKNVLGLALAH